MKQKYLYSGIFSVFWLVGWLVGLETNLTKTCTECWLVSKMLGLETFPRFSQEGWPVSKVRMQELQFKLQVEAKPHGHLREP